MANVTTATVPLWASLSFSPVSDLDYWQSVYCMNPPDDDCTWLCSNSDVSGLGVTVSIFLTTISTGILILYCRDDVGPSLYSHLANIIALALASIIALVKTQLGTFDGDFVLTSIASPVTLYLWVCSLLSFRKARLPPPLGTVLSRPEQAIVTILCLALLAYWITGQIFTLNPVKHHFSQGGCTNLGTSDSGPASALPTIDNFFPTFGIWFLGIVIFGTIFYVCTWVLTIISLGLHRSKPTGSFPEESDRNYMPLWHWLCDATSRQFVLYCQVVLSISALADTFYALYPHQPVRAIIDGLLFIFWLPAIWNIIPTLTKHRVLLKRISYAVVFPCILMALDILSMKGRVPDPVYSKAHKWLSFSAALWHHYALFLWFIIPWVVSFRLSPESPRLLWGITPKTFWLLVLQDAQLLKFIHAIAIPCLLWMFSFNLPHLLGQIVKGQFSFSFGQFLALILSIIPLATVLLRAYQNWRYILQRIWNPYPPETQSTTSLSPELDNDKESSDIERGRLSSLARQNTGPYEEGVIESSHASGHNESREDSVPLQRMKDGKTYSQVDLSGP